MSIFHANSGNGRAQNKNKLFIKALKTIIATKIFLLARKSPKSSCNFSGIETISSVIRESALRRNRFGFDAKIAFAHLQANRTIHINLSEPLVDHVDPAVFIDSHA